ncbi:MAG: hypothetical protein IK048_03855 [Clostridia bacterium]|nr:hypothetical protein [Clostridia bacterium]
MEFDENKKLEVTVTENEFVESKVEKKKRRRQSGLDALDVAIIPVAIGVFVSLGFLFANLFRATTVVDTLSQMFANITNGIL